MPLSIEFHFFTWSANERFIAIATNLREQRVFFNFNAPALVVGEVPMKHIHLVHGQQIEVAFYLFHRKKVSANIQMHATPSETRFINNGKRVEDASAVLLQQL